MRGLQIPMIPSKLDITAPMYATLPHGIDCLKYLSHVQAIAAPHGSDTFRETFGGDSFKGPMKE